MIKLCNINDKYLMYNGTGKYLAYKSEEPEYTVLDYLEATGTQWIDTLFTLQIGDEIELKNVQCVINSTGFQTVFSAGTGDYQTILLVNTPASLRAAFFKYFATGAAQNIDLPLVLDTPTTIKVDGLGNIYYNDEFVVQSNPGGQVDSSLRLFYRTNNSSPMIGKIGAVTVKRNGKLVLDLISVLDKNSIPCMYDLVTKQYLPNQGTGKFTYNLFDANNAKYVAGYISTNNNGTISASTLTDTFYMACQPNTTYKIERTAYAQANQIWRAATSSVEPYVNMKIDNFVGGLINDLSLTITTGSTDKYLLFSEGYTRNINDLSKFRVTIVEN